MNERNRLPLTIYKLSDRPDSMPLDYIREIIENFNKRQLPCNDNNELPGSAIIYDGLYQNCTTDDIKRNNKSITAYEPDDIIKDNIARAIFKTEVYAQGMLKKAPLLKVFQTDGKTATVNTIVFLYNKESIYAITSGSGWSPVHKNVDQHFPSKVAAKLLSNKGMHAQNQKPLLGKIKTNHLELKKPERTDPLTDPILLLKYTAKLRDDASIRALECFRGRKAVNVTIGYGLVRFETELDVNEMYLHSIIGHLDRIDKNMITYTWPEKNPENGTNAFVKYTQEVPTEEDLDGDLRHILEDFLNDGEKMNLHSFEFFSNDKLDSFRNATVFKISFGKYQKNITVDSYETPTLIELLETIRQDSDIVDNAILLNNIRIRHNIPGNKFTSPKPLLSYVEGSLLKNGTIYFRAFNKWYFLCEDFIRHMQNKFVRNLNTYLIDSQVFLKHPWDGVGKEEDYNELYRNEPGFLVGDKQLIHNIELFDLLFYDEKSKTTYLFHVKKGFDQSTRVACAQMVHSANMLQYLLAGQESHSGQLKMIYNKMKSTHDLDDSRQFLNSFEDFKKIFSNPVYVYAVSDKSKKGSRSLKQETEMRERLTQLDIEELLRNENPARLRLLSNMFNVAYESKLLATEIYNGLVREKYVSEKDQYVTCKLICSTKKYFFNKSTNASKEIRDILFKLLARYHSQFPSIGAKMSFNKLIDDLQYDVRICEIHKPKNKRKEQQETVPGEQRKRQLSTTSIGPSSQKKPKIQAATRGELKQQLPLQKKPKLGQLPSTISNPQMDNAPK